MHTTRNITTGEEIMMMTMMITITDAEEGGASLMTYLTLIN